MLKTVYLEKHIFRDNIWYNTLIITEECQIIGYVLYDSEPGSAPINIAQKVKVLFEQRQYVDQYYMSFINQLIEEDSNDTNDNNVDDY